MLTALLALITVAHAGWKETARENDCVFSLGDRVGDYSPVRAECDWPIAPDVLHRLVGKLEDHDLYFSSVKSADALDAASGIYRQVHQASGISDREIILEMGSESIAGGTRYWWKKAADQGKLSGAGVEVAADTGKWEITNGANGGSHVVYELYYDPAGSVPGFLVRWFQGSGTRTLVGELRTRAEQG